MSTAVRAFTARIPHLCDSCHWMPGMRGMPTIAPGHRYLRHTVFPNCETNQTDQPYSITECVECVCERDSTAGLLVAGACATFCHGTTSCALPHRHDGDHSCWRCIDPAGLAAELRDRTSARLEAVAP